MAELRFDAKGLVADKKSQFPSQVCEVCEDVRVQWKTTCGSTRTPDMVKRGFQLQQCVSSMQP